MGRFHPDSPDPDPDLPPTSAPSPSPYTGPTESSHQLPTTLQALTSGLPFLGFPLCPEGPLPLSPGANSLSFFKMALQSPWTGDGMSCLPRAVQLDASCPCTIIDGGPFTLTGAQTWTVGEMVTSGALLPLCGPSVCVSVPAQTRDARAGLSPLSVPRACPEPAAHAELKAGLSGRVNPWRVYSVLSLLLSPGIYKGHCFRINHFPEDNDYDHDSSEYLLRKRQEFFTSLLCVEGGGLRLEERRAACG